MVELLSSVLSWPMLIVVLVGYGFAPGALLRLVLLSFRREDPRRRELLAELRAVPRIDRPFWVLEQLEVAAFEGVWPRVRSRLRSLRRRSSPAVAPPLPQSPAPRLQNSYGRSPGGVESLQRLTVNITPRASEALRAAAGAAPSKTDEINKAIQAYALITGLLKEHDDSKPTFRVL